MVRACLAALVVAGALGPGASSAAADVPGLVAGLAQLDGQIHGRSSLSASQRASVHAAKSALIKANYGAAAPSGITYADVMIALDCVDTDLQRARNSKPAGARSWATRARGCQRRLAAKLRASGKASKALQRDVATLGARIAEIATAIGKGKEFGAKSTALRKLATRYVKRYFDQQVVGGVSFGEAFSDLECVDVKVEAGRISGASACARRLARLIKQGGRGGPPKPPIVWGSALAGDPVAIAGAYLDDTEFWTQGVTVPVAGTITQFRLKIGADPETLPMRFSVVRPQPDGQVKVITTTNPPYMLPGNAPGTYTFDTSALSFECCAVQPGDIVTVDDKGTPTPDPYVWFAASATSTTFSHTSGAGDSQNAGVLAAGTPHAGYETLLQVVEQPS